MTRKDIFRIACRALTEQTINLNLMSTCRWPYYLLNIWLFASFENLPWYSIQDLTKWVQILSKVLSNCMRQMALGNFDFDRRLYCLI